MIGRSFTTRFYQTPAGAEPVREFLRALSKEARAKCGAYMQDFEWKGFALPTSRLKKLDGDIWELRPEYEGIEYRLYFGTVDGMAVYVHAVIKKQQKSSRNDIQLAQSRLSEWKVKQ